MSQQRFSYFDHEQETVYQPRDIDRPPGESYERQREQGQTVYYVTPEQSLLRGEKLIPTHRETSYANWIATAALLLMLLIGGLIWSVHARSEYQDHAPYPPGKPGYSQEFGEDHSNSHHGHHHRWRIEESESLGE